ncbi:hypothetical protein DL96DRAFT_1418774, partial [Flagelloscypha sp. PMI_526]
VEIGDVGYINKSGGFKVLFNALRSATDQPLVDGVRLQVPENFQPLHLTEFTHQADDIQDQVLAYGASKSISLHQNLSYVFVHFSITKSEGAVLMLRYPVRREDADQEERIRAYLRKYSKFWYRYATALGLHKEDCGLIFVDGFHQISNEFPSYHMAAWKDASLGMEAHIEAGLDVFADFQFGFSFESNELPQISRKSGPS